MQKRFISTKTTLEPYGLVRVSGEVSRNEFFKAEDAQFEPPFFVGDLQVIGKSGEVLHGRYNKEQDGRKIAHRCFHLDQREVVKCEEVLIEKYIDDEQAYSDTLIDEMIERGRAVKHYAYA